MGAQGPAQVARVGFDTGVVVSALVFAHGRLGWLREAWRAGRAVPLVSRPTVEELLRVLAYPKFRLARDARDDLLAEYLPYAEVIALPRRMPRVPVCRDPGDQMFLQLAAAARADALVSGDSDLLALAPRFPIPILRPEQWRARRGGE